MTAHDFANVFTQVLAKNGYKLVRENSTTISNLPGWRIECIMGGYEVQVFVVKKDGTAFTIKFNTPTLKAPESLPVFNKILGSFHFT